MVVTHRHDVSRLARWRDCPAWMATAAILASAVLISRVGDTFWEQGWGPALALAVMAAIALLVRRITWDVFWALAGMNVMLKGAMWLFDTDGPWVLVAGTVATIGVAYLVGDRPLVDEKADVARICA